MVIQINFHDAGDAMKMVFIRLLMLLVAVTLCGGVQAAAAKQKAEQKIDPAWSDIAKWPNFMGGVWGGPGAGGPELGAIQAAPPPFKPAVLEQATAAAKASPEFSGSRTCLPDGLPIVVGGQFFYTKGTIFLMSDLDFFVVRQIHMNMKEHGDPDPTLFGHSIGHWQGDTLVVDTVAFLPDVKLTLLHLGGMTYVPAVPGNGATHIVETFRLLNDNQMEYVQTITNDEVFTKPWVLKRTLSRNASWSVQETYCEQNNRNAPVDGKANINMTPPK
jgi:hypothetical protein